MSGDSSRSPSRSICRLQVSGNAPQFGCNTYVHPISRLTRVGLILPSSVCIRDAKEAFSVRPRFPENFQYMVLDVEDNEEQNLIRLFPSCVTFLVFLCITLTGTTTEPKSSSTMRFDQGGLCLFIAMVRRLVKKYFSHPTNIYRWH